MGININNLNYPREGTCAKGANTFDQFAFHDGSNRIVRPPFYEPQVLDTYNHIRDHLAAGIDDAIACR